MSPEAVRRNYERIRAEVGPEVTIVAAIVGPTIGPCCYEVGEEVASPFRARFGADVVTGRKLDLWTSAERALREAGCASVERLDLCTACAPDRFFSYRRNGKPRGGHGVLARVA